MKLIQVLNHNALSDHDIKYEALAFFKVVENYFNLTPDVSARAYYIFKETWSIRFKLFHNIGYENIILGIVLYSLEEFYDRFDVDTLPANNITKFVKYMYGNNDKYNLIQIYHVMDNIKFLFS